MTTEKDHLAFEILARENSRMLTVYLRALVRDETVADDLFQEAMVVAWKRLEECDLSRPFGPWLRGIAAKLVMAHYRKRKAAPVFLDEGVLSNLDRHFQAIQTAGGDTWDEKIAAIHGCLDALSPSYRTAIDGRYFKGLKPTPLAKQMGISIEACKKRLVRARSILSECLKRKDVLFAQEART